MNYLQIEVTDDELDYVQRLAHEQGFQTLEAYVKSLIFEPTKAELLNDIREAILAARRGDPMPTLDDLWAELEHDETPD